MDSKVKKIIRQASHAGDWYEADSSILGESLKTWLSKVSRPKDIKLLKGIIGPHAGYYYSGFTAAWSYANISPAKYNRIILLGPCHYKGITSCGLPSCNIYETPLGNLKVDTEEVDKLSKLNNFVFMKKEDEEQEHSLEMHLPYIKYIFGEQDVKLLPVMIGSLNKKSEEYFGKIFAEYLKDDKTLFIVSSDFCHWGMNFDYMPYDSADGEIWQHIEKLDKAGIDNITKQDPDGFLNYLNDTDNTICGRHPITVFLYALKYSGLETKTNSLYYKQSNKIKNYLTIHELKYSCRILHDKIIKYNLDQSLDLRNIKLNDANNKIYKILKKHKWLKVIIIEFNPILNDTHILQVAGNPIHINLNGCQNITDRSLIHISNNCLDLERLELYWIPNITDKGIKPIIQKCKKLKHLNLSGCKHVTNEALSEIPKFLKELTFIDLTRCIGLTDEVLEEFIKELKNLKHLNLYALPFLKCDFLLLLAETKEETPLEFLDLCGNQNVSDDLWLNFETSCAINNLSYLNLTWCVKLTDKSIEVLSKKFHKLELLSLHGLLGITDKAIECLSSNQGIVQNLKTLDVHGCKNILNKDETYLKSKFPNLKCFKYHF